MNLRNKLILAATSAALSAAMLFSFGATTASANPACYQYNANGFQTSTTPVFNNICNVPNIGNESDFVRIRPHTTGSDEDDQDNPNYTIGNLDATCNTGDTFDLWNYMHNNAESDLNDNGSGSAVAHDVQTLLSAQLGQTSTNPFTFGDTITSKEAPTVSDTATLNCGGKNVSLSIVPSSVNIYYENSNSWATLPDGTINHPLTVGSPTPGSGIMWGCWNYRMVIVYEVKVTQVTPTPPTPPTPPKPPVTPPAVTATCDEFTITPGDNNTVTVNGFKATATNSTFKNAVINWGDSSNNTTATDSNSVVGQTHQYANNGTYDVSALVTFTVPGQADITSGGSGTICSESVTFSSNVPPVVTPPSVTTPAPTTPVTAQPAALVNTGPGSVIALFAAAATIGTVGYRSFLRRNLSRQ